MRAAPLLFASLVLIGCGSATKEDVAATAAVEKQSMSYAPEAAKRMVGEAMASAKAADVASSFRSGSPVADEAVEQDQSGKARTAALERIVAPRLVVRNAELSLEVKSVERTERQVGEAARAVGGIVEASQGTNLAGPTPGMSVTLRVPVGRFDEAIERLEGLGKRTGKTISSEDVTANAVDMDARVKSLRVQEDAYRAILAAARRIPDVLEIQQKLTEVRTEIEQIVAQRRGLGDQAARSTIVVNLSQTPAAYVAPPPPPAPDWLGNTWAVSTGTLRDLGILLAQTGIWTLTMLPIWLPLVLLGVFLYRRYGKEGAPNAVRE